MDSPKLNSIELPVTDMAPAKKFYEDGFGWTFTDYGPTYAGAQVGPIEVGFTTEAPVGPAQPEGSQSAAGALLLLQTDDLDSAMSKLVDCGAVVVTDPFDFPGGSRFHFRDPSGNVLGVYRYDEVS